MPEIAPSQARRWLRSGAAGIAVGVSIVAGLVLLLGAFTLGRCDAFGGRCPADRPALLADDVFGMATFGAALLLLPIGISLRPGGRRIVVFALAGVAIAVLVGLLARSAAHG